MVMSANNGVPGGCDGGEIALGDPRVPVSLELGRGNRFTLKLAKCPLVNDRSVA